MPKSGVLVDHYQILKCMYGENSIKYIYILILNDLGDWLVLFFKDVAALSGCNYPGGPLTQGPPNKVNAHITIACFTKFESKFHTFRENFKYTNKPSKMRRVR